MPNTSPAVLTATTVDPLASAAGTSHVAEVLDGAQRQRSAPVRVSSATRSCAANTAVLPATSGATIRSKGPASAGRRVRRPPVVAEIEVDGVRLAAGDEEQRAIADRRPGRDCAG